VGCALPDRYETEGYPDDAVALAREESNSGDGNLIPADYWMSFDKSGEGLPSRRKHCGEEALEFPERQMGI